MKIALSVANMSVGGIATFVLNLSSALVQAGHAVTVVAQQPGAWWPRLAKIGVNGYCSPYRRWDSVQQAARRFATYLTEQEFDLLVVNIGIDNRLPMLALHFLSDRIPVVLVLHSDQPATYALAALNRSAWNCVIGVSPRVQQVAALRFEAKPIHFILHGVELPTIAQLRSRLGWETPLRLLFVGRLIDAQKGIFRLPAILAECRRQQMMVHLTIIGDGPDQKQLQQLFIAAGVEENVTIGGFQTNEAVWAAMRTHHLLLAPSTIEGLGLVILEAQANGCVPIATHLGGVTDVTIIQGVNGILVEPTDIIGFVDAIRLFMLPERWHRYSQAAVNHAQQHYAVQRMGDRYVALFEGLQRGLYPLQVARSALRKAHRTPFTWQDYLPRSLYTRLHKIKKGIPEWVK